MNLLGLLGLIIFIAIAGSNFYFWSKGQKIIFKYVSWKDAFRPWTIKKKVPEYEWKLFKKYERYRALCFFGGVILILLLFVLQWNFHLFIKDPEQP